MSLVDEQCWLIVCDTCGWTIDDGNGISTHFDQGDHSQVTTAVRDMGWREIDGKHTCEACFEKERGR